MSEKYIAYPLTVKSLAEEIIKVCDDYKARKLSNEDVKEQIWWYAAKAPDKLFNGSDYNSTVKKIIGKRRIELLDTLLDGFQHSLGGGAHGR